MILGITGGTGCGKTTLLNQVQQGGLATAGAAGDSQDHASSSASTMWKAAAFFSRFWTA